MADLVRLIEGAWPELQIAAEIGQGVGSRVYRAKVRQGEGEDFCAVKAILVPDEYESIAELRGAKYSDEAIEDYLGSRVRSSMHEIQNMQKLSGCGHIVRIEDHKLLHPEPFQYVVLLRMELLTPLVRQATGGVNCEQVAQIGMDLCDALSYCHERKIVHHDIKPSNIFVDGNGTYKLGDFSASKEYRFDERTLTVAGTPQFMAPEAFKGSTHPAAFESAVRTDIYSLGLVLYWLLNDCVLPFFPSGRIATYEEARRAFERRVSGEALPAPAARNCDALLAVIRKATDYDPEKRYASAAEMKAALLAAAGKAQVEEKSRHTHRRLLTAGLCALLIALIAFAGWFFFRPAPLPRNLNLPLHVEKDYINVIFLYPTQLTDRRSLALSQAQFDSAIEENWERWGVRDSAEVRRYLQKIIDKNFCAMQADLRAELVAYFPYENEDYSEFTEAYTKLGMPLFAFSSTEDETIYSEWTALMKWVHP